MRECEDAEQHDIPMYMIAPDETDITPLLHFSWRPDGIHIYHMDNPASVTKCYQKIHMDRKWVETINKWGDKK